MKFSQVYAKIGQNRLYLILAGHADARELNRIYTDVRFCVADLCPGYDVIVDLSRCNLIFIEGLKIYKKIIDYLIATRVGSVVRVVHQENVSFKQILNFTERIQSYKAMYAGSLEEAEKILVDVVRRDGIRFRLHDARIRFGADEVQGTIIDISTGGCAVASPDVPESMDEEIPIFLDFEKCEGLLAEFSCRAKLFEENPGCLLFSFSGLKQG